MKKYKITKIILDLLSEYKRKGITAFDINNGYCDEFACKILDKLPKAIIKEIEFFHLYIFYNGKFYDAECIYGVKNYQELPIFKRQNSVRSFR